MGYNSRKEIVKMVVSTLEECMGKCKKGGAAL